VSGSTNADFARITRDRVVGFAAIPVRKTYPGVVAPYGLWRHSRHQFVDRLSSVRAILCGDPSALCRPSGAPARMPEGTVQSGRIAVSGRSLQYM